MLFLEQYDLDDIWEGDSRRAFSIMFTKAARHHYPDSLNLRMLDLADLVQAMKKRIQTQERPHALLRS